MRQPGKTLSLVVFTLLVAVPARAQDKTAEIDKIFSWVTPGMPGCAVAASHQGKQVVNRAYGVADLERNVAITPDTIFDAGSVVKQFVAASVLMLAEEGRLSLTDDIRKYIPELPDPGHRITVDHLLTHTSGVRDWTGILPFAAGDPDALTVTLRQRGLNFTPGEEWAYSNSGYVLLKEMVGRVSRMTFGDFTRKRLFEPLGMKSTSYLLDMSEVGKNLALAYEKRGDKWTPNMMLGNARGGGGALFTTATDLLIWIDALMSGRLGRFVTQKIQEPAALTNGRKLDYARGLIRQPDGLEIVWHSGSAAAYKTIVGHFPAHAFSIAIMCNAGEAADDRDGFAARTFDLFVPGARRAAESAAAAASPKPAAVEGLDLNDKAGLFFNEQTQQPLRLGVQSGTLRVAGGPALTPLTKDRFKRAGVNTQFMSGDAFELTFLSADQIELKSMEGKTTRYRRAQPYAPTATDLQAFAGRYESKEVGSIFKIEAGQNGVTLILEHLPVRRVDLTPVDRDTFQRGGMTVRFHRDAAGQPVALDWSTPVNRNIKFTRVP
jgi:CubicO group peptidase (beta-lactamase class C family)